MAEDEQGKPPIRQGFGKRRPLSEDPASMMPAVDASKPPVKRSQAVSLVLVAGAGIAAIGLGRTEPPRHEEDVLIYADAEACAAARIRTQTECREAYARARSLYPGNAPRYPALSDCERHHGADHCVSGESAVENARGPFMPRMAAFYLGRTAEQNVEPEPIYEHQPEHGGSDHGGSDHGGSGLGGSGLGGWCRGGSGGRVFAGASGAGRISSPARSRVSFGGFGKTGRSYSASSRSSFGGG